MGCVGIDEQFVFGVLEQLCFFFLGCGSEEKQVEGGTD